MSTFFEKLTGTRAKNDISGPIDLTQRPEPKRVVRKPAASRAESQATRLKIESDEYVAPPPTEDEGEGELTVDIYDKGDDIVIQSTVAGVKPEDLDISITSDTVTIRGKREQQEEVRDENYYYKELFWGGFSRSVILPEEIDEDAAEASMKHGLLTIRLPKKRRGTVQKLKVKVT